MRFGLLSLIEIGATTIGILVGVTLRLERLWILVAGLHAGDCAFSNSGLRVGRVALASREAHPPSWHASTASLWCDTDCQLLRVEYGARIRWASHGHLHGAAQLGLYNRASVLLARPVQQFMSPLESVFIPTLSRLQNNAADRCRRVFLEVYNTVALASFLFTGVLLAVAGPVTLAVLEPHGPPLPASLPLSRQSRSIRRSQVSRPGCSRANGGDVTFSY